RVADLLLGGEADPGDTIVADVVDDSLHCTVDKPAAISDEGAATSTDVGTPAAEQATDVTSPRPTGEDGS
ncbi:hypothetical protein, partial [Streptomyces sp. NPDC059906]|uniref:hypothetical protein n=1 Tax=Streptomyces sp. NPDC059906 TaxID=3346997 RepID=UPI00366666ED